MCVRTLRHDDIRRLDDLPLVCEHGFQEVKHGG
jgi:hypothetical protein